MTPTVVIDSREQKPYRFPGINDVIRRKLDVGDYTYDGFEHTFAVERKTLDDLATSMGAERLRFENEIRRANGYAHRNDDNNPIPGTKPDYNLDEFVVVIEADREDVEKFAGNETCPNYYSNIYPNSILGTVDGWPHKYDNLSFAWAGSRADAKQETLSLLDKWHLKYS